MTSAFIRHPLETRLILALVLEELHADGMLADDDFARIAKPPRITVHPLVFLSELHLPDASEPGSHLTIDKLLDWLAARISQEVVRIDPLKINVTAGHLKARQGPLGQNDKTEKQMTNNSERM